MCHTSLDCVLQRILSIDYTFPSSRPLSESCRDLIAKMLVRGESDPGQGWLGRGCLETLFIKV